ARACFNACRAFARSAFTGMNPQRQLRAGLLFLAPNFLGFLLFTAWPVVASLLLSFSSWDLLTPPRWVGLENFTTLLGFHSTVDGWQANDADFWKYLGNTLFLLLGLPINIIASLFLASILSQKLRFTYVYRVIYYLPHLVSGVAIFYLWRWMYNPDFGLINGVLAAVGINGPDWLLNYYWAKPADRKSTRLNSSHVKSSYAVFCLKKKSRSKIARPHKL